MEDKNVLWNIWFFKGNLEEFKITSMYWHWNKYVLEGLIELYNLWIKMVAHWAETHKLKLS